MRKLEEIIATLQRKIEVIAKKYNIVYCLLFGSLVRKSFIFGESDIDIAVKVKNLKKREIFSFLKKFTGELGLDNLDVVILNFAPFSVKYDALREGMILYCQNHSQLIKDKLKLSKLHDDWVHIAKVYEEKEIKKALT